MDAQSTENELATAGAQGLLAESAWPRGRSNAVAALDLWCRDIAGSTELRKWFAHDPARLDEFIHRYQSELADPERAGALVS